MRKYARARKIAAKSNQIEWSPGTIVLRSHEMNGNVNNILESYVDSDLRLLVCSVFMNILIRWKDSIRNTLRQRLQWLTVCVRVCVCWHQYANNSAPIRTQQMYNLVYKLKQL